MFDVPLLSSEFLVRDYLRPLLSGQYVVFYVQQFLSTELLARDYLRQLLSSRFAVLYVQQCLSD